MCFLMVSDGQSQLQTSHFLSFSAAIFPTAQVHTLLLYLWPPGWTICVYCVVVEGRNCNCNLKTLYDLPSEATVLRWGSRKDGLGHTHDASGSDICVPIRTFFRALWGKPKQIFVVLKQCPAANKLLQAFVWIWLIHTYLIYLSYLISFSPSFTFLSVVICPQDFIFNFVQFVLLFQGFFHMSLYGLCYSI